MSHGGSYKPFTSGDLFRDGFAGLACEPQPWAQGSSAGGSSSMLRTVVACQANSSPGPTFGWAAACYLYRKSYTAWLDSETRLRLVRLGRGTFTGLSHHLLQRQILRLALGEWRSGFLLLIPTPGLFASASPTASRAGTAVEGLFLRLVARMAALLFCFLSGIGLP